jgi:hypothetical protein
MPCRRTSGTSQATRAYELAKSCGSLPELEVPRRFLAPVKNDKCQRHLTSMSPTGWAHREAESSAIDHMHEMCMCRESDCVDPAATHDAPANYISELIAWRRLLSGSAEKRRRSPCGRLRCPNAAHLSLSTGALTLRVVLCPFVSHDGCV